MSRRDVVLPLIVLLVLTTVGCTAFGASSADVTVENSESSRYQMTVYVFEEPVGAGNVTFRVTNETGTRKAIRLARLGTEGPYFNHSLGGEWNATERRVAVPANETTTASFGAWDPGTAIVYVFEGADGRVIRTDFAECASGSLSHTFVFSEGPENGYRTHCLPAP
ncbi:hypothetical protein PM022_17560 [Halorubrum ezzemoulense]|uniref:hypothetical protein n=1 Tax=Halorubrum ezzemoulense TaxID=337243 RepID=UPI00232E525E|nr:hypothetical protein [Halorubrum ezzemoulense]MDB2276312.1 hypothetical protein [Halorubrum ezzemoulense]